jgi:hypothetical protein
MDSGQPLFTGDDYQLIAEAIYREEERLKLFNELHGLSMQPDDQLDRLADLAKRIGQYLSQQSPPSNRSLP